MNRPAKYKVLQVDVFTGFYGEPKPTILWRMVCISSAIEELDTPCEVDRIVIMKFDVVLATFLLIVRRGRKINNIRTNLPLTIFQSLLKESRGILELLLTDSPLAVLELDDEVSSAMDVGGQAVDVSEVWPRRRSWTYLSL